MRMNPYHLVDMSPWPLFSSISAFLVASSLIFMMHLKIFFFFFLSVLFLLLISFLWWRDVVRESSYMGFHLLNVKKSLQIGMVLFIISEIFFFFSFFWTLFHSSLNPSVEINIWPPYEMIVLDPLSVPLLNTVVLLSSSISVTFSHHSILHFNYNKSLISLLITLLLSFFFTLLQVMEYKNSFFNLSDSVYSSVFFMATSFHSFHVIVSSLFLLVNLIRMKMSHCTSFQHVSYECAIWYWHFVDVVWVFLYISLYWWSSIWNCII